MNRTIDIRILALGLLLGVALLVRPIDPANASHEITGSITGSVPAAQSAVEPR